MVSGYVEGQAGPVLTPQRAATSRAKHSGTAVSGSRAYGEELAAHRRRRHRGPERTLEPVRTLEGEKREQSSRPLEVPPAKNKKTKKTKQKLLKKNKTQPVRGVGVPNGGLYFLTKWVERNGGGTHAKRRASIGSRRGHAGHGGAHPWGSAGEEAQSVEVESWNQVGLQLQGKRRGK